MADETALLELVNVIGEANDRGEWDQKYWAKQNKCKTTCCAAGFKALIDGKQFLFDGLLHDYKTRTATITTDGYDIEIYAQHALGLTTKEADYLFNYMENNYDKFVERVKNVINNEVPREYSYYE